MASVGTTITGFDASNAFMSVHRSTLDKLVTTSFEDEKDRPSSSNDAEVRRSRCAQTPTNPVWISSPPEASYRGNSVALLSVTTSTVSKIAKWERICDDADDDTEYLYARCFSTGDT